MDKLPGPRNDKARGFGRRKISIGDEGGNQQYAERYYGFHILIPNVTGQRTRHLVEGTLDPLVRFCFIGSNFF